MCVSYILRLDLRCKKKLSSYELSADQVDVYGSVTFMAFMLSALQVETDMVETSLGVFD